jgi:integrase
LTRQYRPDTVRTYMGTLRGVFAVAVEDYEWLATNPLAPVRKPPASQGRLRFLSDAERERLLSACQQSAQPVLYLVVILALTTGARKNELMQLRWPDLDLERGFLRLAVTKTKMRRAVPITGLALTLLRQHAEKPWSPWVFPRRDGAKAVFIDDAWRTAVRRAGLSDFRFHDLRHTCASYLAMSGATLREIAEVLGHANIQRTMKYAHLVASHTAGVVERMTTRIFGEGDSA